MSRITRRTFLRTCTAVASATTLAACTWANTTPLTHGFGQPQLTIWSPPGSIDQALARWRRINPDIDVRRQVVAVADLAERLKSLPLQTTEIPDLIVTDSYTIAAQQNTNVWRHIETASLSTSLHPAALGHVFIDERRIVGMPLTYNPLKLWYQSDILRDTAGLSDDTQIQAAIGNNWSTFASFVGQLHRSNPIITTLSSCFDDVGYPLAVDAMAQQRSMFDVFQQSLALAQQRIIGRAVHFGGEWFDLLKRNSVALLVGGRYLGPAIARTWNSEMRSPWQTISHPLGNLYGPSVVAAIPIQAARYEQATQLMVDLANDPELQLLISNESGSMPALISAQDHPELQRIDSILPQRTIRDTWSTQETMQVSMIDMQRVRQIEQIKDVFYDWQNSRINDEALQTALTNVMSSTK